MANYNHNVKTQDVVKIFRMLRSNGRLNGELKSNQHPRLPINAVDCNHAFPSML